MWWIAFICLKVITKENGGHGSVINCVIQEATGKYFKVVDGDDWVDKRNFKKLISCQENEICIQTGRHRIRITGRCLAMAYFASEEVKVTGCITSICYEE